MKNLEEKVLDAVCKKGLVDMIYYSIRNSKKFSGIVLDYFSSLLVFGVLGLASLVISFGDYLFFSDITEKTFYLYIVFIVGGYLFLLVYFFLIIRRNGEIKKLSKTDWVLFLFDEGDNFLKKYQDNKKINLEEFFRFGTKLTVLIQLIDSFFIIDRYKKRIWEITYNFLRIFKDLGEDPFCNVRSSKREKIVQDLFWKWQKYEKKVSGADFLVEKTRKILKNIYQDEMEQQRKKNEEETKKYMEKIQSLNS